jgi:2-C-methyl-D-erythritol 2,4-cyclodiphosphate synthase
MTRIGIGYDVHRLVDGRKLIIGGVDIPHAKGLLGHSDADVLLHAICDALLGAAGLGDIGKHFPDTDPRFKGSSSVKLLSEVSRLLGEKGFRVNNIDTTVVAERPKLAPHITQMTANIATAVNVDKEAVNIKATTTEGLGFAGKSEGIAAYAVCTIARIP